MSPRPASVPAVESTVPARGFILVGVAMFVLVLTILGLSLFSLSGFEAQFFVRTNERTEAFNTAASGIERARFALLAHDSLNTVWQALPGGGLQYAVALQGTDPTSGDSTGLIDWGGDDIWIRTVAKAGQAEVTLQARFDPTQPENFYKRLIAARRIQVTKYNGANPRWSQTYMSGAVMLSDADTSWNNPPDAPLSSPLPRPPIEFLASPLPLPDLNSYFAQHLGAAHNYVNPGGSGNYTLNANAYGGVAYFYRPPNSPADLWTVDESKNPANIFVSGTVVWLADPGIIFRRKVQVSGNPLTDRLIIVARPKDRSEATGALNFEGGIISDVPMILVSDGKVRFDCQPSYDFDSRVSYLSIYSGRVQIGGPEDPTARMDLMHTLSLLPNQLEPIIDQLYALNVLPTSGIGSQSRLTLVPGSWQERSSSAN